MGAFSIWHWIIFIFILTIPIGFVLGIIRGVDNKSVLHAILSFIIPWYGFVYYFNGQKKTLSSKDGVFNIRSDCDFSENSIQGLLEIFISDKGVNSTYFIYTISEEENIYVQGIWSDKNSFEEINLELVGKKYLTNPDIFDNYKLEKIISYGWNHDLENFSRTMEVQDCLSGHLAELIFVSLKVFDIPEYQINPHYIIEGGGVEWV